MVSAESYEARTCRTCSGTGIRHDITNADRVNADGSGVCHTCKGSGTTMHLRSPVTADARAEVRETGDPDDPVYAWLFE